MQVGSISIPVKAAALWASIHTFQKNHEMGHTLKEVQDKTDFSSHLKFS